MITRRGRIAFANARVRALKSRLFGREFVNRAGAGRRPLSTADATSLSILADNRFAELIEWYACVIASYPAGRDVFLALLRRFEIENVKLAWRVVAHRHPLAKWAGAWVAMGELATVTRDAVRDAGSLSALAGALNKTPYASIAAAMLRAHPADLLAAEMGFDAWSSRGIVDAAMTLRRSDLRARELALALVRARDLEIVRRFGGKAEPGARAIVAGLTVWPRELKPAELLRLAAWTADDGPLWAHLPRQFRSRGSRPVAWDDLTLAWRIERRELCRRAFLDQPFCVSPAVALLVLKEEEVRGLSALVETTDPVGDTAARERALAGGLLGA